MNKKGSQAPLTEQQRAVLKPALDKVEEGSRELADRLEAMGREVTDDDQGPECFYCGCRNFVSGAGRGPLRRCGQPGCGHSRMAHFT